MREDPLRRHAREPPQQLGRQLPLHHQHVAGRARDNPPGDLPAKIARALVEEGLAACVNIVGPIRSVYFWDGAVQDEAEQWLDKLATS